MSLQNEENSVVLNGEVVETLPNAMFRVKLDNGHTLHANVSGKIRKHYIRILRGDRVRVMITPPELNKGRIVFRDK